MTRWPILDPAKIRAPAAAGRFYSEDPVQLREEIEALLASARASPGPVPKAIIAPHAGYIYSGPVAASAYKRLLPARDLIKRVVLIGPSHYAAFGGLAISSADAFATPLGLIPVDATSMKMLGETPFVSVRDAAHAPEHSLEVHLPFLQSILREFTIVPLLAGEIDAEQLSRALDMLWDSEETRLVVSSDLSHYLSSEQARRVDRATAQAIESLDLDRLGEKQACGCIPIRGLLQAARDHHLTARTLDLRNSGDTAGPQGRVVGYGAFCFEEARL
jgi:AmmeMemoRadiSam system protein B